jgi:hypothetical protein
MEAGVWFQHFMLRCSWNIRSDANRLWTGKTVAKDGEEGSYIHSHQQRADSQKNDPEGVQQRKVVGGLNSGEGHV